MFIIEQHVLQTACTPLAHRRNILFFLLKLYKFNRKIQTKCLEIVTKLFAHFDYTFYICEILIK